MSRARRGVAAVALGIVISVLLPACTGPRGYRLSPERALAGFQEASPLMADLIEGAAAVAVFVSVEGSTEGRQDVGVLLLPDGGREEVVLRCLQDSRAPGGSSYHQLVVLRHPEQVELLRRDSLELDGFVHRTLDDEGTPEDLESAPGWVLSTRRSQLLFGDQKVRQRLESRTEAGDPVRITEMDSAAGEEP